MYRKRYSAFTLIEMLLVMSILVIIGGLSFAAYQQMQVTIRLNEYTNVLEENIRRVQREAMLLKRYPGESWIYGLGIDFTKADNTETWGRYEVFKWCASDPDYGNPRSTTTIPGYAKGSVYGDGNGLLPALSATEGRIRCNLNGTEERLIIPGYEIGLAPPQGLISFSGGISLVSPDVKSQIKYLLFESVTGRAFFYGSDNSLIGYQQEGNDDPVVIDSGVPSFNINIVSSATDIKKQLMIEPFSGKVAVKVEDE